MSARRRLAVVTGASSGIGAATVRALRALDVPVVAAARREDRLRALSDETGCSWRRLDVTDPASVTGFTAELDECAILVNNAGGAKGLSTIEAADDEEWRWMYDANVLGLMRMTRALLPLIERSGDGHIVNVGSIAGFEVYRNGAGYTAAKHAVHAVTGTLRLELLGRPVRVTEVDPAWWRPSSPWCGWATRPGRAPSTRA